MAYEDKCVLAILASPYAQHSDSTWIAIHSAPILCRVDSTEVDYDARDQQACVVRRDLLTATQDPNSRYCTKHLVSKCLLRENALHLDIQVTLYLSPYCSVRALPCFCPKTQTTT